MNYRLKRCLLWLAPWFFTILSLVLTVMILTSIGKHHIDNDVFILIVWTVPISFFIGLTLVFARLDHKFYYGGGDIDPHVGKMNKNSHLFLFIINQLMGIPILLISILYAVCFHSW